MSIESNINVFYISPDEAEKDDDGDVIMTDYVDKNKNIYGIIDGDTTSVSTHNEDDDDYDDDIYDDDIYDDDIYDDDIYDY